MKLVIHNHLPKRRRVRDTGMSTGKPRKDLPEDFSDFEHGTIRKQPSTKPSRYSEREDPSEMERPVIAGKRSRDAPSFLEYAKQRLGEKYVIARPTSSNKARYSEHNFITPQQHEEVKKAYFREHPEAAKAYFGSY